MPGDGFGSLSDGMAGELTREDQLGGSLHFAARQGLLLGVLGYAGGLGAQSVEEVIAERVHNEHALLGDSKLGVHLLQDSVDD